MREESKKAESLETCSRSTYHLWVFGATVSYSKLLNNNSASFEKVINSEDEMNTKGGQNTRVHDIKTFTD